LKISRVSDLEDVLREADKGTLVGGRRRGEEELGGGRREEWGGNLCVKKKPLASLDFRTEKLIEFASNLSRQPLN